MLLRRLALAPEDLVQMHEGTVVFVDISGFTRLSERLARSGREGAERLTDAINRCFSALLEDAYEEGGGLLKFGGDALLLWFDGPEHARRACLAAAKMRNTLRRVSSSDAGAEGVPLRMSVGIHSGTYGMFLVGVTHREFLIGGAAASEVVAMEALASAGQIVVSAATAAQVPSRCLGDRCGPGVLLRRAPVAQPYALSGIEERPSDETVAACLSEPIRAVAQAGDASSTHRTVTIAFLQFGGIDELLPEDPSTAARALDELVGVAQSACARYEVCLLGSDVAAGGGKLIFTAGAPRAHGDDEERMLLAMRQILDHARSLPIRIGVNRGRVFAGEIGPHFRRTYTVMGDAVNLAARLMAAAPWGSMYVSEGVLERSQTGFEQSLVEPFYVKGKIRPVQAIELGQVRRATAPASVRSRLPLIGRDEEMATLRSAVDDAQAGLGSLVELVGETGSGKSRLLTEVRELGKQMRFVHATCEPYTQMTPYFAWREPLRQLLDLSWDDGDEKVIDALRGALEVRAPDLLPWLPLLAIVVDAETPTTVEVEELAPEASAAKLHEVVLRFLEPELLVPTLVEIEHAHLMDEASAALLTALARTLGNSCWMVIVSRRDATSGFVADPENATRLELEPLNSAATLQLAEASPAADALPPHTLRLAVERSGGNPEFLLDLLAAAAASNGELPDGAESAAAARLDALESADCALVRRAAVLGLTFHAGRLRTVLDEASELPDESTWARLSSVFAFDPDGHVRFKRPALREVAYHGLPFKVRRQLHQQVADSLEQDVGTDVDADPAILSLHCILAGDHTRAWKYARLGAERAVERFAHADAARLYQRAVEAGSQNGATTRELAECLEALGMALHMTGQLVPARNAVTAARRLSADDLVTQGRLFYRHTRIAEHGAVTAAVRWALRGLRGLDGIQSEEATIWRARLLARLAFYRLRQRRLDEAERLCRAAIAAAEQVGELEAKAYAYFMLDWILFEGGRHDVMGYSEQALELFAQLGNLEEEGNVLNNLAMYAYFGWRWDEALDFLRRAADCRERAAVHSGVAATEVNIGEVLTDRGQYDEAGLHIQRAKRLWSSTGERAGTAYATALLGRLAARTGREDEGLVLLRDAADQLRKLGERVYVQFAESLLAEAEAFAGDPRVALKLTKRLIDNAERELPLLHRVTAVALARLGRNGASAEIERSLTVARERGALYDVAAALDLSAALGDPEPTRLRERDEILARLGVQRLPSPQLAEPELAIAAPAVG